MCVLLVNYKDKCALIYKDRPAQIVSSYNADWEPDSYLQESEPNQFKINDSLGNRQITCVHSVFSCKFWPLLSKDCGYSRLQLCMKNFYCRHQSSLFSS